MAEGAVASSEGTTVVAAAAVTVAEEVVATAASSNEARSPYNLWRSCTEQVCHTWPSTSRARHLGTRRCWPGEGTCLRTTLAVAGLLAWVEVGSEAAAMAVT